MLAWLLGEPDSEPIRESLAAAELVLASDLTLIECDRVLHRAVWASELTEARAAERRARLAQVSDRWVVFHLEPEIVDRSRRPFPGEPIRTLDAIHLATALVARGLLSELSVLALDSRVRRAARELGLELLPAGEEPGDSGS